MSGRGETRTSLLDVAQDLAQRHGYNGFSYHELARRLGMTTASIHYHFRSKEDLGCALMARYRTQFATALERIAREQSPAIAKLERFVGLFQDTLSQGNKLCLCGMLASEYETLPGTMRDEVRGFFLDSEEWLVRVLEQGARKQQVRLDGSAVHVARAMLSTLEGAMIAARTFEDQQRLAATGAWLIRSITPAAPAAGKPKKTPTRGGRDGNRRSKTERIPRKVRK